MSESALKTKAAVLRWLEDNGWKISKTQFYAHCSEGRLRPDKNSGSYRLADVQKYAQLFVAKADTGQKVATTVADKQEKKLDIELEREEIRRDRERLELQAKQGMFIDRQEHELAIVGRAVAFMAHLGHSVQESVVDWIDLVEGDQKKANELVDAIMEELSLRMSDFTADIEVEVIMEGK